ncbi:MAG TPA: site-specific integrase [Terracidiphilus sp.]|nr:site-specific integrase [Terracidiphilus sp.]
MVNVRVALMRRVKTPAGWRYYPAAYSPNGRVKPGVAVVAGNEVRHPSGYYALRYCKGPKPVFERLNGVTPAEAEARRRKKESQLSLSIAAKRAEFKVEPIDPDRKLLSTQLEQFLAATVSRGSLEAAEVYELACKEFLQVTGHRYLDELDPRDLVTFQQALFARGMSTRTVSNRHANVKAFLLYCGIETKSLPKPPKYDKTMPEIYMDQELTAFFAAVTSPKENLLFRVFMQTGVREQEAMYLEWTDIDPDRKILSLKSKVKRFGFRLKDFEERELPLNDDLLQRLLSYKRDCQKGGTLLFPKHGKPDGHMLRMLKRLAKAAKLNCGECDGCLSESHECERWYLHKFRATYCTKLLRSGVDIRTVQAMMGHSDLASTMRYLRPAENKQTQARINGINWW